MPKVDCETEIKFKIVNQSNSRVLRLECDTIQEEEGRATFAHWGFPLSLTNREIMRHLGLMLDVLRKVSEGRT